MFLNNWIEKIERLLYQKYTGVIMAEQKDIQRFLRGQKPLKGRQIGLPAVLGSRSSEPHGQIIAELAGGKKFFSFR